MIVLRIINLWLTFRTLETAAAQAVQKIKPHIEDPLIDFGAKTEPKKKDA